MGYSFKIIDKRRQEAPFLILEKNIYENLNVSTVAKILDIYDGGIKLVSIPQNKYFEAKYCLLADDYKVNDLVLVIALDYIPEELDEVNSNIIHDYQNAVILGKLHNL